jgi:hypothetical protein
MPAYPAAERLRAMSDLSSEAIGQLLKDFGGLPRCAPGPMSARPTDRRGETGEREGHPVRSD